MQHPDAHNLAKASPLFRGLHDHEIEAVIACLQLAHYTQGTYILERGVWQGRLHIIAAGQVSVLLQDKPENIDETAVKDNANSPATRPVVALLGPGECFGEMSLITGEPPTATIRAEQHTTLWSLTQTHFLSLITTCPTLLQNINTILSQRLARTNRYLVTPQTAEVLILALIDSAGDALAAHICDALAYRSASRVLLLELCGRDVASSMHFATRPAQIQPGVLNCARDKTLLATHETHARMLSEQALPAIATVADTQVEVESLDNGTLAVLSDLSLFYDFIVLVVTQYTPPTLLAALLSLHDMAVPYTAKRVIQLVSAQEPQQLGLWPALQQYERTRTVFVSNAPGMATVGEQDRYAKLLGCKVTRLLPEDNALLAWCWQKRETLRRVKEDAPLSSAVDFVARYIAHQTVGIAFGGGSGRGFAHLGVLDKLLAYKIPLDYVAACSSGIIAPGMHLVGKTLAENEEIFMRVQRHIVQWNLPRSSLFSNRGLKRLLREVCGEIRFDDLTTPFAMVAADLTTRSGVVLERGLLWQAALASVALPGVFPPVIVGEHILIDAGMHDPVPVRLVHQMGADILLASELAGQAPPALTNATPWFEEAERKKSMYLPRSSPHMLDILLRTYDLAMATIGMHSIREADVVFRPKLSRISLRQFSEGRKFIPAGREAVEQALPELRLRLPWL